MDITVCKQIHADVDEYTNAKGWHVDDKHFLHILKPGGGNIATYTPGNWASVHEEVPEPVAEPVGKTEGAHLHFEATGAGIKTPNGYLGHNPAKPGPLSGKALVGEHGPELIDPHAGPFTLRDF